MENVYTNELVRAEQVDGDKEKAGRHKAYAMRAYLLYLVDTTLFVDKSSTYVDVLYLRYFEDSEWIHEYNQEAACLVYLYSKLSDGCRWKTKKMTINITLFTVIFIGLLMFVCHFHYIFTTPLLMMTYFDYEFIYVISCISVYGLMLIT